MYNFQNSDYNMPWKTFIVIFLATRIYVPQRTKTVWSYGTVILYKCIIIIIIIIIIIL